MSFSFDPKKATQALAFFADQANGTINKMKALKLVFFADRYHLRRYGRPITGDYYVAMKYGPVPSGSKDMAEGSDFLDPDEKAYAAQFVSPVDKLTYKILQPVDTRALSKSDLQALEWTWQRFGALPEFDLANYTHGYPEWKKWEEHLKRSTRLPMDYADFLLDPEDGSLEVCHPLTPDRREAIKDGLEETASFEARW